MSLKTSFFNSTLFKANIRRFWWVGAGYIVLFLTVAVLPMIDSGYTDGLMIVNVLTALACALMPSILFSYLNSAGSVTCLHAFPIKRKAHYITNILTIYALFLAPMLVGYAFSAVYAVLNNPIDFPEVIEYFVLGIIMMTITSSGAALGVMVTGNTIASIVFGALFIGFPFYTEAIFKEFLRLNVYGIWQHFDYIMLENFRVDKLNGFMWIYFIISLIVFAAVWFLYKYRKLESNGDIIAFSFLKPLFIGAVAIFVGFLGYFYLYSLYRISNIFFMLPFGIIGIIVSYMLSRKAFTFKGMWKPAVIYTLGVCALFAVVKYDLTGFEKRIPDIEDIASVNISDRTIYDFRNENSRYINGKQYYFKEPVTKESFAFTEKDDILNVIKLHEHLIQTKHDENERFTSLPIVYTLKNGKEIKRYYNISYDRDKEFLAPVYTTKQMKDENWFVFSDFEKEIVSVNVYNDRMKGNTNQSRNETFAIYSGNDERAKALINALKQDLENVDFEYVYAYSRGATRITIEYKRPMVDSNGKSVDLNKLPDYDTDGSSFIISPQFTNTIKLLTEYGLYKQVAPAEDISHAEISFNSNSVSLTKITELSDIKALYEYCDYWEYFNNYMPNDLGENIYTTEIKFYNSDEQIISEYNISDDVRFLYPEIITLEAHKYNQKYGSDISDVEIRTNPNSAVGATAEIISD